MLAIGVTLNWSPEVEKKIKVDKEEKKIQLKNLRNKSIEIYKNVATRCRHKKREKNSPCKKTKNSRFLYFTSSS